MKRKVILVLGKTGQGKSYFTRGLLTRSTRTIILDPMLEYEDGVKYYSLHTLVTFLKSNPPTFRCICRFTTDQENDLLFDTVKALNNVLFVVEETEIYVKPRAEHEGMKWLINYGRHRNIHLLCVARRLNEISTNFRAQITTLVTFRQEYYKDLEIMEEFDIDVEKVRGLSIGQYEYSGEDPKEVSF